MSSIKIPPDASINVQDSFRDVRDALRSVEARLVELATPRVTENDISQLQSAVLELAKKSTYRTWEDVFGNFPRVENLFAAFLITKGNVSTGEQVLAQKEFDSRELPVGKALRGVCWGKTTNTSNVKTLRIRILEGQHNTIVCTFVFTVSETGHWFLAYRILRSSQILLRTMAAVIGGPANLVLTKALNNVAQPTATVNNTLIVQITGQGTADNDITIEGGVIPRIEPTLEVFSSTVGNITTGEDTLAEKILHTNDLLNDGQSLRGVFWGKCANNANAKTLRLRIIEGANNSILVSAALTASEAGHWFLAFEMSKFSATVLRAVGQIGEGQAGSDLSRSNLTVSQITATLANAVTIRLTGDATSTDDITVEGGVIPSPANTVSAVTSTVGNVGSGEDTLAETILGAAGTQFNIGTDGMTLRGIYWGHTANNANVKTLRARLIEGANNNILVQCVLTVSETGSWCLGFELLRKDVTTLLAAAQAGSGPANASISICNDNVTQPTVNLDNAVTIRITGDATTTDDITLEGGSLSFVP